MPEPVTAERYKWCILCGACIKEFAKRCRICRATSADISTTSPRGAANCADATRWLPEFPQLIDLLPDGQLKQLLIAAILQQTQEMLSQPAIDALIGYQLPPEKRAVEMLKLIILQTASTPLWSKLEDHPRVHLLDLTHEWINHERTLCEREAATGNRCPFCAEFVLPQSDCCRYCGTAPTGAFARADELKPEVDERFLRLMVLHIAASARLESLSVPLLDEAIASNGISESEIALELGRLSSSFCPSYEQELPFTTWENKLLAAEQVHHRTQFGAVRNMVELAKACRLHQRFDEAHALLKFVSSVIFRQETDQFLRDFMLAEWSREQAILTRVSPPSDTGETGGPLEAAANLADTLNQTAMDMLAAGVTNVDLMNQLMKGTEEERISAIDTLKNGMKAAADAINKMLSESENREGASKLKEIMESAAEALDATSLSVKARGAFSRGDYATAEQLARRALSSLVGDTSVVVHQRAIQLCFLAEIYTEQNKTDEAVPLLEDAVEAARRLPPQEVYDRSLIYRQIGAGFEKLGHLERAKEFYELSICECEQGMDEIRKSFPDVPLSADLANLLCVYAGVLHKLGLHAEAQAAENKARGLRASGDS